MRTCETCKYEHAGFGGCITCEPGKVLWKSKREAQLVAQLAAKDAVIKGLVEVCNVAFHALCGGCDNILDPCPETGTNNEPPCHAAKASNALRAAIAAAKEEKPDLCAIVLRRHLILLALFVEHLRRSSDSMPDMLERLEQECLEVDQMLKGCGE